MQKHHEWGNFFRPDVTPFAYNETVSQQWYPLDEKNSKQRGYQWNQKLPGSFQKGTLSWNEIPDTISKIEKDWISSNKKKIWEEVLACTNCGKNFQILEHEFVFYKNFIIPLPKTCPDCRYKRRKILMRPRRLWERTCACEISGHDHEGTCNNTFQTTYVPNSPENVFCEKCYLKTIG